MTDKNLRLSGSTRVFGVIAHPAAHVRAPMVFNPLFAERGLDHVLVPIDAPPEHLGAVVEGLRRISNFGGFAVTIPHKVVMAGLCDTLGECAQLTGAVNVVRFDDDGTIHGENFDGAGFVAGLRLHGRDPEGMNILMIGAGGAARAIGHALLDAGVACLSIQNRTGATAEALAGMLGAIFGAGRVRARASGDGGGFDMVVNATSLGLHEGDAMPLGLGGLDKDTIIADIIMVPERTKWLETAEGLGLRTHYGRHMLDCQIELIGKFMGAL